MVSVLFARKDSIYKSFNCDVWDKERDATKFESDNPVICHPPCRAWGKLSAMSKHTDDERELAIFAIEKVRSNGGILEHPKDSKLFNYHLPKPGYLDEYGGHTIYIDQYWFGHKARKPTFIYICGINPIKVPAMPMNFDCVEYGIDPSERKKDGTRLLKSVSKKWREATPEKLAKWLIAIAEQCDRNKLPF